MGVGYSRYQSVVEEARIRGRKNLVGLHSDRRLVETTTRIKSAWQRFLGSAGTHRDRLDDLPANALRVDACRWATGSSSEGELAGVASIPIHRELRAACFDDHRNIHRL